MPSVKGTSSVADDHAMSKLLKSTKFPATFGTKVNLSKINRPVLSQWIEKQISKILGFEDEIVSSTAINLFLDGDTANPRRAQLDLAGFLGEDQAATFADSLWGMLIDAQSNPSGIPKALLEEKKQELAKQQEIQKNQEQNLKRENHGSFRGQHAPPPGRHSPPQNRYRSNDYNHYNRGVEPPSRYRTNHDSRHGGVEGRPYHNDRQPPPPREYMPQNRREYQEQPRHNDRRDRVPVSPPRANVDRKPAARDEFGRDIVVAEGSLRSPIDREVRRGDGSGRRHRRGKSCSSSSDSSEDSDNRNHRDRRRRPRRARSHDSSEEDCHRSRHRTDRRRARSRSRSHDRRGGAHRSRGY